MMEAPQRELNTLMLQNKNLLHAFDYPRAGSAPPQMDEGGSPMAGVAPKFSIFGSPHGAVAPSVGDGPQPVNDFGLSESKLDLANPEYIRYYYANKNINPRLPPPTVGRSNLLHGGKAPEYVEHGSLGGQVQHDAADAQAALNILLSSQLGLKDDETSTSPIPIHSRSFAQSHSHIRHPSQQGGDQFAPGSWTARIGPATDHLDALLQAYSSPQTLSPLVSGDLSNAHQNTSLFSSLRADDATLQDALFNGGSAPHTPRSSSHANLLFDATVGSPPQSKRDGILSSQDPQVAVGPQLSSTVGSQLSSTARSVLDPTGRGSLRKREPSKLRQSSNNVDFSDPHVDLLGSNVSHMSDAVSNAAQATAITEALQNLPQGLLPSMLPGMAPEPMAGMGMGMGPGGMEALLGNQGGMGQGMQHQSQLQNMYGYMAAMYPYYAQQAMQAAGGGGYPGFMGMPGMPGMNGMGPMMGYPGFPMMNQGGFPGGPGMPDLRAGFAMMPPGGGFPLQMPGMMPFGPMGGIMPPEYAGYYQKVMEEQAAMAAAVGGKGMDDSHGHGDLKGMRPPGHGMPDGINEGMPGLNGNANRRHQRDMMSPERQQHRPMNAREVGRGSPVSRRENSARDGGMGSGLPGATARKVNSRREEDKPVDAMLEEFKNNKNKKFELKDIFGHVFEFSLDQHGSRFIQQKLESVPPEELSEALEEVLPKVVTLMTDVFGNYVVQKFLEHGSPEHRLQLAQALKGNVLSLSLQMYGCRIVQKALEVLPTDVQCEIVAELDGQVMRCVRDQNGNHVIQKIIECVPTARVLHLLDSLLTCVVPLSSHPFGCRVVQRILEHCQDAKRRGVVMDEILKSTCLLSQDQYGNYVIQHVLERGTPAERMQVVTQMAPEIVAMAMHKFASNVVEKCLIFCSVAERDVLIHSMLGDGAATAEDDPLQLMMKDQFGNYVVQKVLEVCDDVQRELLLGRVRMQLHALKKYTYAKHIVSRVEKLLATGQKLQTSSRQGDRALPDDSELQSLQVMQQLNVLLPGADANAAAAPQGAGVSAAAAGEGAAAGAQEGSAQSAAPETAGIQDEASAAAAVAKDSQSLHDAGLAAAPAGAGDSETGTPGRDEVPPKRLGSEGGVADGTGTVGADGAS